jgi:hypothetical protein
MAEAMKIETQPSGDTPTTFTITGHKPVQSWLFIAEGFGVSLTSKMPNAWIRFWQRLLLGWEWRKP